MTARILALACLVLALLGCGSNADRTGEPAGTTYDGPLHVDSQQSRWGAAGEVIDCRTPGEGGASSAKVYGEGATADSPEDALETARGEGGFGGVQEGLTVAAKEDDRVLYVLEVDGTVKQAVIVHDGPATKGAGGPGWYVESWAKCDDSEMPPGYLDSIGHLIWTDAHGRPVPTTVLDAWVGPAHCDWQSMTFLELGGATYVGNADPELADFFAEKYRAHADLPADAVDTGYQRGGRHLWLSADKQRAYVGTTDDVELWPRTVSPLGCD